MKIIYVDDDPDLRELAEMCLRLDKTLQVTLAAGGAEALDAMLADPPDVALVDVMMPQMDGPGLMARMRETPALADVPVIFITARSLPRETQALTALGAAGLIAKPFDPLALAKSVHAILADRASAQVP